MLGDRGLAAVHRLYCAPGNAGIAQVAECIAVAAEDIAGLVALAKREKIDFVVVGPEAPLVAGLADRLAEAGIKVFGPSQAAARLEGSKGFTKDLCKRHNIPTGAYERFTDADEAEAYIRAAGRADRGEGRRPGRRQGRGRGRDGRGGVEAARDMLAGNRFGAAGAAVVIEEFLEGEEASFFALCDGECAAAGRRAGPQARRRRRQGPEHRRHGRLFAGADLRRRRWERVMDEIVLPTVRAMGPRARRSRACCSPG